MFTGGAGVSKCLRPMIITDKQDVPGTVSSLMRTQFTFYPHGHFEGGTIISSYLQIGRVRPWVQLLTQGHTELKM